jgi:hypothetical protein
MESSFRSVLMDYNGGVGLLKDGRLIVRLEKKLSAASLYVVFVSAPYHRAEKGSLG